MLSLYTFIVHLLYIMFTKVIITLNSPFSTLN